MCIAYPARVLTVGNGMATVDVRGRTRDVILTVLEDRPPTAGDWLLVQSGIALARIDPAEAAERSRLVAQLTEGTP
jgi:hydrogenase assembly chaperone HypC/HupF